MLNVWPQCGPGRPVIWVLSAFRGEAPHKTIGLLQARPAVCVLAQAQEDSDGDCTVDFQQPRLPLKQGEIGKLDESGTMVTLKYSVHGEPFEIEIPFVPPQ